MNADATIPGSFLRLSTEWLRDEYLPRIRRALEILPPDRLWWRPHDDCTSPGNLLLHLEGNVRQWIIAGLGGREDHRARRREFTATEGAGAEELVRSLTDTVEEACSVIERLPAQRLLEPIVIQGFATTPLHAVYHVVEHFSWHVGQIVWAAKQLAGAGHGLAFYDDDALEGS